MKLVLQEDDGKLIDVWESFETYELNIENEASNLVASIQTALDKRNQVLMDEEVVE